ncbi:hypothetical protein NQZ68_040898 [Dissostichus eleginoides]|nr:hypothetical protein NQZ68_040898 [Dissostichus eleginoides]
MKLLFSCSLLLFITAACLCGSAATRKLRGISSSYKRFYRERRSFLCIDGSRVIPFEQVNDDYCDCEDGSDEPGTSACPRGRFYCTNLGFRPHYIPSSRVNDGICDCCDASDEYNSHARCQNSCWNLGQRERAYVEGQMRTLDEGLQLKQQLIEEGVLLWREKQAQLRELQQVAEDLQIKLEEHRRRKQEAEQTLKALEAGDTRVRGQNSSESTFRLLDSNKDGSLSVEELQEKLVLVQEEELLLSEEEAVALMGGGRQMDLPMFQHSLWDILNTENRVKIRGIVDAEDPHLKAADTALLLFLQRDAGGQQHQAVRGGSAAAGDQRRGPAPRGDATLAMNQSPRQRLPRQPGNRPSERAKCGAEERKWHVTLTEQLTCVLLVLSVVLMVAVRGADGGCMVEIEAVRGADGRSPWWRWRLSVVLKGGMKHTFNQEVVPYLSSLTLSTVRGERVDSSTSRFLPALTACCRMTEFPQGVLGGVMRRSRGKVSAAGWESSALHMRLFLPDTVTHSELTPSDTPTQHHAGGEVTSVNSQQPLLSQTSTNASMFILSVWILSSGVEGLYKYPLLPLDTAHLQEQAAEREASSLKKVEEAYDTINMEISDLRKKLAIDYGPDWEFLFLNSQCYQLNVYEYTYNLCPFNQVTQKSTAGTEVSLGRWGMWAGTPKNPYSQMVYENGEPCWQGGSRSTTVTLTCGTETALCGVKEPSKCQYIIDFQTPVACQPVLKQRGIHSEL